jgi:predicted PurR-regulated permease PerM
MNTFGKVLQTQILLSFINCILSMIVLWIMQIPNVLGLGVMMFLLGIIPVAGVFISLAPLSIIAFLKGGWNYVLAVLIMTIVLHFLGSYVLYPKLMSDKLKLPVFFTFLILIISAHYFGVWGMLVGTPVFVFLLDILDVKINDTNPKLPDPSLIKSKSIGGNAKSEIAAADKSGKIK